MGAKIGRTERSHPNRRPGDQHADRAETDLNSSEREGQAADGGAEHDAQADEDDVGRIGHPVGYAQRGDRRLGPLRHADDREHVAALHASAGCDGNAQAAAGEPREKDAACERLLGQFRQGDAVVALAGEHDLDRVGGAGREAGIRHLGAEPAGLFDDGLVAAENADDVAGGHDEVRLGPVNDALPPDPVDIETRVAQEALDLGDGASVQIRTRIDAEGPDLKQPPQHVRRPAVGVHRLFVGEAFRSEIDPKEARPEMSQHDDRYEDAHQVSDGEGRRHPSDEACLILGAERKAADRIAGGADRRGFRQCARHQSRGRAGVVTQHARGEVREADADTCKHHGQGGLGQPVLPETAKELRASAVADGEQEQQEKHLLQCFGECNLELAEQHRDDQHARRRAKAKSPDTRTPKCVAESQSHKKRDLRPLAEQVDEPAHHEPRSEGVGLNRIPGSGRGHEAVHRLPLAHGPTCSGAAVSGTIPRLRHRLQTTDLP